MVAKQKKQSEQEKSSSKKESRSKKKPAIPELEYENFLLHGTEYKTLFTKKFAERKNWVANDPKKISSFLPGTIMNIFVKKGQKLEEGEPVLILEAMKMRNIVKMPMDGVVKSINVAVGDTIPKGHLIFELK